MIIFVCIAALVATVSGNSGYCNGGRNEYVKMSGSCDKYYECIESSEFERTCPDGMYFNSEAPWPQYPCGYPGDVQCTDGVPQAPRSTADCPHEYGLFESPYATSTDCGKYRRCVAGVAFEEECPIGLAFNVDKAACDWPSDVASCNAEAFVGFSCPPGSVDENGCDITENFPLPGKCYSFIACHRGNPRLVSCDLGFKFDTSVNRCVNSDLVRTDFQCELRHERPHICNNSIENVVDRFQTPTPDKIPINDNRHEVQEPDQSSSDCEKVPLTNACLLQIARRSSLRVTSCQA